MRPADRSAAARQVPVRTPGERGGGVTVSKNPPLTEDQIRQSAEAEARHAATQAPRPPGLHDRAAEAAAGRRRARDDRRLLGGPLQGRSEQDRGLSSPRHRRARSSGPRGRRADQPARDQFALDRRPDRGWLDPVRRGARAARGLPRAAPSHSCPHSVDQGRVRAAARDRQGPRRRSRRSPPPLSGAEPLTMKSVSHSEARWALLPEHVIRCNGHMVNDSYTWRQPALLAPSRLTWLETHAFDLGVGRRDLRVLPPA